MYEEEIEAEQKTQKGDIPDRCGVTFGKTLNNGSRFYAANFPRHLRTIL